MNRFDVVQFDPGHLAEFMPQVSQAEDYQWIKTVNWGQYAKNGFALTAMLHGEPICIGGITRLLPRIGEAWLVIGHQVHHREMLYLFRAYRKVLQSELQTAYDRVQMTADAEFKPAVRMAEMLGMVKEGEMKNYPAKGKTSYLLARTS